MIPIIVHKSIVNHMNCYISWEMLDGNFLSDLFNLDSDKTSRTHMMMGDFHLIR